ncbi:hypothetical protein SELMODRAFT_121529, partial [Selaginella moellendorffii]
DFVTWTMLITVYAQNGEIGEAKLGFDAMPERNELFRPEEVAFVNILNSCSHLGLLAEARLQFQSKTTAWLLRGSCVVDILGRAGRMGDAEELLKAMPFVPDEVVWASFLNSCRIHSDLERGGRAAKLRSNDPSHYLLLATTIS